MSSRKNIRIIPRLEIKGDKLIKGIQLEGLRVVGEPAFCAKKYYEAGADELIYSDVVASLYGRNSLIDVISNAASQIFIPLTVGGGINSTNDVETLLRNGADKVSINSGAIRQPELIRAIANQFGSQCCVLEVQAKDMGNNNWNAFYDNGRENSGLDVVSWAMQGVELGAGELLITSIDKDGTRTGMDVDLISEIAAHVKVPVIASGGIGAARHVLEAVEASDIDAVCLADFLHFQRGNLAEVKTLLYDNGFGVRL